MCAYAVPSCMCAEPRCLPLPVMHACRYQMPTVGAIGGAKDLGDIGAPKRKRVDDGKGGGGGKALSKEEEEALARREAARQRVQQRTLQTFGMG